jgi:hypothetical protein
MEHARELLIEKYKTIAKEMAALTEPECSGKSCRVPHSCCAREHCEAAERFAKEEFGIELQKTDHPTLPYMGKKGCTVEPHLRIICTVHVCCIANIGTHPTDKSFDRKYYKLREKLDSLLYEILDSKED